MVEQYLGAPPPATWKDFGAFSMADRIAQGLDGLLLVGKFFPIFAVLFGVSFVIQAQAPEVKITSIYRGIIPFLVAPLILIALMFLFPGLALWLPNALYG